MKRIVKWLCAIVLACTALAVTQTAEASHFRYGNITWRVPNPTTAPRTVEFTVTTGWRFDFIGQTDLNFGDGTTSGPILGSQIGGGFDAGGLQYFIYQFQVTHTYAVAGQFTAFFESCCRVAALINASNNNFRVESRVSIDNAGSNTAGPVSGIPVIIQFEVGSVNQFILPVFDPDADPHTCRFSTAAESGIVGPNPPQLAGGDTLHFIAPGCSIEWDGAIGAVAGNRYAVSIAVESSHNGQLSKTTVDYIIEWVPANTKPTCAGSGNFVVDIGQAFSAPMNGTDPQGGNLTLSVNGLPAGATTVPTPLPATQAQPFASSFNWTPVLADAGQTYLVQFTYRDPTNISDTCTLIVEVPLCPGFGNACSVGVGACQANGTIVCQGVNPVCSAMPGTPSAELCNGIDDDCNMSTDDNPIDAGQVCPTGLPGVCAAGVTVCNSPNLSCVPNVLPGTVLETCNALDDDCDNQTDEGFPLGQVCTVGLGECANTGVIICDGSGGTTCSVSPLPPGVEICGDNLDSDCDGDLADTDVCLDSDGDGIIDIVETQIGSDPQDQDSDDDGVADGDEPSSCLHQASCFEDTDGDGLINILDPDSDNDGLLDGTEMGLDCSNPDTDLTAENCLPDGDLGATTTDPLDADTDDGGVSDGSEDANLNGVIDGSETDPTAGNGGDDSDVINNDTDGDGLSDNLEDFIGTDPNDQDSDDDGVIDSLEPNPSLDSDGDGLINPLDPDSDNDGLYDGTEMGFDCSNPDTDAGPPSHCFADADDGATTTSPLKWDTDGGGVSDGSEDANLDGAINGGETDPTAGNGSDDSDAANLDSDSDGLSDAVENFIGSDPQDADTDDDGVLDGVEPNPADDTDGDGLVNVLDVDSDDDGLYDGTEMGFDCNDPDTEPGHCIEDADPSTTTSPLKADTDDGGASDGSEDANLNGAIDSGETDPTKGNGADDSDAANLDSDGDGLSDALEDFVGSDPNDDDSDDDGLLDGDENNPTDNGDTDYFINLLDVDSDDDGLYDGTEAGQDCDDPDTAPGHCIPDADPTTTTSPVNRDTDGGGVIDGSEDSNLNGAVDGSESDPTKGNGADDTDAANLDSDGDGLSDALETFIGSNPNDLDSDDDGLLDADENNPADDMDEDGDNNAADFDADNDGLFDGTEKGNDCMHPATDETQLHCIEDADPSTNTNHLDPDTDDGGTNDGDEDADHDGSIDNGETDPNDPSDDGMLECTEDDDCPDGQVCQDNECVDGCHDDADCLPEEFCDPGDGMTLGECLPDPENTGGGGQGGEGGEGGSGANASDVINAVGGCGCNVPGQDDEVPWLVLLGGLALARIRRKQRRAA